MVTMAQRIEELRTEQNMSRPALAAALGFPKNALEKFETGRQSPTKEQAQKLADFFGVSMFYLKGESNDRTRMDDWMGQALSGNDEGHVPIQPKKAKPQPEAAPSGQGSIMDSFLKSKAFQDMVRSTVTAVLRSPEGQDMIAKVVKRELERRG